MGNLRIGVSACLLGANVRYDGRNKREPLIAETLSQEFEWVPVCPEVEMGLGTPREPMHLEGDPQQPRLVTNTTGIDLTDRMQTWCDERIRSLKDENLCGFIFKSRSPSCGMDAGLFARAFVEHFPDVPIIDEALLRDSASRTRFIKQVARRSAAE